MSHKIASESHQCLPERNLSLTLVGTDGSRQAIEQPVQKLLIAGWAGRETESREAHIRELELLGVPRPKKIPEFYRLSTSLLTTSPHIEVVGKGSSGEAECILFSHDGDLRVGLGSDHTDRNAEVFGVALSKQLCSKPVASELWAYHDVAAHWDELTLRSYIVSGLDRTLYQQGKLAQLLHPMELLDRYRAESGDQLESSTAMFCGTVPVHGGIGWAESFYLELYDPVLNRRLTHQYDIHSLPVTE